MWLSGVSERMILSETTSSSPQEAHRNEKITAIAAEANTCTVPLFPQPLAALRFPEFTQNGTNTKAKGPEIAELCILLIFVGSFS